MYADLLAEWFPAVRVEPSVLYVDDDPIFTSAGTTAGIDLCLHLIAKDHGATAAAAVARGMVLGPHRTSGQAQLIAAALPASPGSSPASRPGFRRDDDIGGVLDWALGNLHEELSIEVLARHALLSTRSFARRFRAATGTTPYAWILEQRIRLAQQLLEGDPALGVEEAAGRAGFSSASLLRQHFRRRFGCSPTQYRSRFGRSACR
jgi:transcriptional regulator GlxA family with amidase domain